MSLSDILVLTGNYFGLLFGFIVVAACQIWIMCGVNFISEFSSQINEIKRRMKHQKALFQKEYITKEE